MMPNVLKTQLPSQEETSADCANEDKPLEFAREMEGLYLVRKTHRGTGYPIHVEHRQEDGKSSLHYLEGKNVPSVLPKKCWKFILTLSELYPKETACAENVDLHVSVFSVKRMLTRRL